MKATILSKSSLIHLCGDYIDNCNKDDNNANEKIYNACYSYCNGKYKNKEYKLLTNFFNL